jgi:uncharacterized protein YgiM (DUF1202 family)
MKARFVTYLLACVSLVSVVLAQDEDVSGSYARRPGRITAGVLNVRAKPGTAYEGVCQLREGDEVVLVAEKGDWYGILTPRHAAAYVAEKYVDREGLITGDRVRVHSGPGLVFTTYAYVNRGDRVEAAGEPSLGWYPIVPPAESVVWISARYVEPGEPEFALQPHPKPEEEPVLGPISTSPGVAADQAQDMGTEGEVGTGAGSLVDTEDVETADQGGAGELVATDADTESLADTPEPEEEVNDDTDADLVAGMSEPEEEVAAPDQELESVTVGDGDETEALADTETDAVSEHIEGGVDPEEELQAWAEETEKALAAAEIAGQAEGGARVVAHDGVLLSLESQSSDYLTHFLAARTGDTLVPVCYVKTDPGLIKLRQWEYKSVRIHGTQHEIPGWQRPVVILHGIQLAP